VRINVIFLYCQDLAKQRAFYEAAFDLGQPVVDARWWVEYAVGDGSHFALHQAEAAHFEGANRLQNTIKFSFEVENIQQMTAKLKGIGARFHYDSKKGYGFWLAEFEDPEGNVVRLYEKMKK
jgi:predicted enzyme related to lactoylglutathione lyase